MYYTPKIIIQPVASSLPIRDFDWCAYHEGNNNPKYFGWGETHIKALLDLQEKLVQLTKSEIVEFRDRFNYQKSK